MKELFNDILSIDDVHGVMLFSFEGRLIFKEFVSPLIEEPGTRSWWRLFIDSLGKAREVDLVFERSRLYVRRTEVGYLMVLMASRAPTAMLRLSCDLVVPSLGRLKPPKGAKHLGRGEG